MKFGISFGKNLDFCDFSGRFIRILGIKRLFGIKLGNKSLNKRNVSHFCSQLKMMLSSGMPLLEALQVIKNLKNNRNIEAKISPVIDGVNAGQPLSESAVSLLPAMAVGLIQAAERVGSLEETLERLAKYYEEKANLDEKVIGALTYPCFILVLSLLSVIALLVFVLPGIKGLFTDLGAELPLFTRLILGLSDITANFQVLFVMIALVIAGLVYRTRKTDRKKFDEYLVRLPFFGHLVRQETLINGFGTLGALLGGGTPMVEALNITASSTRNTIFKDLIRAATARVENGAKLSEALSDSNFFPAETIQMLQVGENAGQLDAMLTNIASFQASEREHAIKRLTTLLEPVMTLTVGVVVGFIVLAIFLPLVNMISTLQ